RQRHTNRRLERPVSARIGLGLLVRETDGSLIDPRFDGGDLAFVEPFAFALGRHAAGTAGAGDVIDEQALRAGAWDDGRAVIAALLHEVDGVKAQAVLLLQRRVTGVAAGGEDRLDRARIVNAVGGMECSA